MQNSQQYPINEIFVTLQGEAGFAGTPSVFIRLQGCDVGCGWCDTKHTWKVNQKNEIDFNNLFNKSDDKNSWATATATQITRCIETNYPHIKHIVITGGEPAMYDLRPLCQALENLGKDIQIETSGTYELKIPDSTWVTLSPKIDMPGGKPVLLKCIVRANEIKMPVGKLADIQKLKSFLSANQIPANTKIWLQPLSQNKTATNLCVEHALLNNWRLSLQTHKFINIR
ncbi:MAG: ygcF [Burkholderiales bacterium]|jgi:7-carboxy-7-deazaguanine synthase|nr:ygcF [Burkholderiales bacterium]